MNLENYHVVSKILFHLENDTVSVCVGTILSVCVFAAVFRSHSCWSALPAHSPGVPGKSVLLWTLPHLGARHDLRYSRNVSLRHSDENRQPCGDHTDHTGSVRA